MKCWCQTLEAISASNETMQTEINKTEIQRKTLTQTQINKNERKQKKKCKMNLKNWYSNMDTVKELKEKSNQEYERKKTEEQEKEGNKKTKHKKEYIFIFLWMKYF